MPFSGDDQPFAKRARRRRRSRPPSGRAGRPRRGGRAVVRTTDRRSAAREIDGRPRRRTRAGTPDTSRTPPSSSPGRSYGVGADDGEARSAVGAVGERVAVAAVVRDRGSRRGTRDTSRGPAESRRADPCRAPLDTIAKPRRRSNAMVSASSARRRRRRDAQLSCVRRSTKASSAAGGTEGFDGHARRCRSARGRNRVGLRHPVDPRPEADALHGARCMRMRRPCSGVSLVRASVCGWKIRTALTVPVARAVPRRAWAGSRRTDRFYGSVQAGCRISGSAVGTTARRGAVDFRCVRLIAETFADDTLHAVQKWG